MNESLWLGCSFVHLDKSVAVATGSTAPGQSVAGMTSSFARFTQSVALMA
ncbi:MAG: hypothetical protein ABS939_18145 [Psychrobacillus sp.]